MIAVPFTPGAPLAGSLSPLPRTPLSRSDTPSRISFEDFLVRRLEAIRQRHGSGATALHFLMCAPGADELWDQIDREALD
jgi:hypothetical protein